MLQPPTSLPPSQTPTLVVPASSLGPAFSTETWEEPVQPTQTQQAPQDENLVPLTFLLLSGKRKTCSFAPETSFGKVKEIMMDGWTQTWPDEQKPTSPTAIRILHLGRLIPDEEDLSNSTKYPKNTPAVVHLSVRPYPVKSSSHGGGSMKKRSSLLRSVSFREPAPDHRAQDEVATSSSCCGCIVA